MASFLNMYLIPPSSLLKGDIHFLGELTAFASRPRLPREGRAEGSLVVLVVGVGVFFTLFYPARSFFGVTHPLSWRPIMT